MGQSKLRHVRGGGGKYEHNSFTPPHPPAPLVVTILKAVIRKLSSRGWKMVASKQSLMRRAGVQSRECLGVYPHDESTAIKRTAPNPTCRRLSSCPPPRHSPLNPPGALRPIPQPSRKNLTVRRCFWRHWVSVVCNPLQKKKNPGYTPEEGASGQVVWLSLDFLQQAFSQRTVGEQVLCIRIMNADSHV